MVFKVNYRQQRSERNRVKQAKKEAKLREREEAAARRKLEAGEPGEPGEATQGIAETDAEWSRSGSIAPTSKRKRLGPIGFAISLGRLVSAFCQNPDGHRRRRGPVRVALADDTQPPADTAEVLAARLSPSAAHGRPDVALRRTERASPFADSFATAASASAPAAEGPAAAGSRSAAAGPDSGPVVGQDGVSGKPLGAHRSALLAPGRNERRDGSGCLGRITKSSPATKLPPRCRRHPDAPRHHHQRTATTGGTEPCARP